MNIPTPLIGVLSQVLSDFFTHNEINTIFASADAPGDPPEGSKAAKVDEWLRRTNKKSDNALAILGRILEEILENQTDRGGGLWKPPSAKWQQSVDKINSALQRQNLHYSNGGNLGNSVSSATKNLREQVATSGLSAIEIEIDRALKLVSDDPNGAAQYAGNVLEATLKHYLVARNIQFSESKSKLNDLWGKARQDLRMNPKDLTDNDLRKIASGLSQIIDGTMFLRDKKSSAHGRTQQHLTTSLIRPRHARLVVHAAHTLAVYILECLEEK